MFGFDVGNPLTKGKRERAEMARVQAMQEEQRASREQMRVGNWESKQRINEAMKQQKPSGYQSGKSSQNSRSKFQFEADDEDNALEDQLDNNLDLISNCLTRLNAMVRVIFLNK
jgi:protein transport protein SEC9